jgi:dynactin complex subunit
LAIALLALTLAAPAHSQDPPPTPEEIAKAAREAREHKANSTANPKIITNDNLVAQSSVPSVSPASPASAVSPASPDSSPTKEAEVPKPKATGCDDPNAEKLKAELQSAQDELDQIRSELSSQPEVISNGNVDLKNFKAGSTGLNMGAPALLETKSPSPARLAQVTLEEKVASLKKSARIACLSPEDAKIQAKIDAAEQQLNSLERELALDQDTYYSKPNYAGDSVGKAKLDAELEQKQSLQSEIERLKSELSAPKPN